MLVTNFKSNINLNSGKRTQLSYSPHYTINRLDRSAYPLIFANLITIVYAYVFHWEFSDLLLVYWWQSVFIGFFQIFKILDLKNFTTTGLRINDRPVSPTSESKRYVAAFFALHYGFFHLVYLAFIFHLSSFSSPLNFLGSLPMAGVFLLNHFFSYFQNRAADSVKLQNLGAVMFRPYIRIIPMHLVIIFAQSLGQASIIFFQILKTFADVVMHSFEHAQPSTPAPPSSPNEQAS